MSTFFANFVVSNNLLHLMKIKSILSAAAATLVSLSAAAQERIILVNEGVWQTDNGRLTYFENGKIVSNRWFSDRNGHKLGDTPNDIVQINDNLLAIALNWSNIVQFITPEGNAVAATEDVPNNRKIASDGGRYVYVTSYGHECTVNGRTVTFTRGFVAKIDVTTFKTVAATEVGYEPEGIAWYKGKLFVANTGGYAYAEGHDYEKTVDVLDAVTMKKERSVDTGKFNLMGKVSQSGQYLLINSAGDHYDIHPAGIVFDCQAVLDGKADKDCFVVTDYPCSYSTATTDGKFLSIGSRFTFNTMDYEFCYATVDPKAVFETAGRGGITETMPGTVLEDIKKFGMPYGIYVNPYTGYIYATDATDYAAGGRLYQWDPSGTLIGSWGVYVNPAHFVALPPDGMHFGGVDDILADKPVGDSTIYNLQGIPVANPVPGQVYIRDGHKFIKM